MLFRHWLAGLTAAAIMAAAPNALLGGDGPDIDRIEEDWEVVIGEPSPEEEAPQIVNVFSPLGNLEQDFAVFELNHRTQPDYLEGGMQLQRWTGSELDQVESWTNDRDSFLLMTPGETVTYTLRMSLLYGSWLGFSVRNGQSETWGQFGGDSLRLVSYTDLPNLNSYSTENSTTNSRIGFASYRVTRFVLKEVRYYSQGELVLTDTTDHVVHEYNP